MNLFASYGMQYMKEYYINESLKSTQNKKMWLFYLDLINFYPFLYRSWKYFVCHRQRLLFSGFTIKTDLLAS